MLLRIVLYCLLFILVLVESTLVAFPLLLICSVITYLLFPGVRTLVVIFLAAFALDVIRMHHVGLTPLIIFAIIFILSFNDKIFDIRDYAYILGVVILGTIVYAIVMNYQLSQIVLGMTMGSLALAGYWFGKQKFAKKS